VKARNTVNDLASIIIPCWNQLEFTRQCIAALMRHTRTPWELIAVDNGSTDGTKDYLAGVQDAAPVPVTVIANATNRGFPAAIDQGLAVARGSMSRADRTRTSTSFSPRFGFLSKYFKGTAEFFAFT
jgi:glycosyltransferase involved in cell wall biosynthesis